MVTLTAAAVGIYAYSEYQKGQAAKKANSRRLDADRQAQQDSEAIDRMPAEAEAKAKEDLLRKRRIQQRTGGKTILASKYGGATETKSLLGE